MLGQSTIEALFAIPSHELVIASWKFPGIGVCFPVSPNIFPVNLRIVREDAAALVATQILRHECYRTSFRITDDAIVGPLWHADPPYPFSVEFSMMQQVDAATSPSLSSRKSDQTSFVRCDDGTL